MARDSSMAGDGESGEAASVTAAADELYGRPLDEFTAARAERVKRARAEGNASAAAVIGKLGKPTVVAWLANQLVREQADEIRDLLQLGGSMREATALFDADQLRELSRQQHELIEALMQQARGVAAAAGQAFSDSTARALSDTLHAAVADEQAAQELSEGHLTAGLSHSGFPGFGAFPGLSAPAGTADRAPAAAGSPRTGRASQSAGGTAGPDGDASAGRRDAERAMQEEAAARDRARDAGLAREQARDALAQAERAAREAADRVARLQGELDTALRDRADADRARRLARNAAERADREARQAEQRLQAASARRERVAG
jgi:hypothetical protein